MVKICLNLKYRRVKKKKNPNKNPNHTALVVQFFNLKYLDHTFYIHKGFTVNISTLDANEHEFSFKLKVPQYHLCTKAFTNHISIQYLSSVFKLIYRLQHWRMKYLILYYLKMYLVQWANCGKLPPSAKN